MFNYDLHTLVNVGTSMQVQDPCMKLTLHKPEDTARVDRTSGGWIQWKKIENNGLQKLAAKVAVSVQMGINSRSQSSWWTVVPLE
jgi:hypothetical protein